MAESIAVAVAKSLATKLGSMAIEEAALLWGVGDEIRYIKDELDIISEFLRNAEMRPESVEDARSWVTQVRQLAYDIEDCIDQYILCDAASFFTRLLTRHQIATEIRSLKTRVEDVKNRRSWYLIAGAPTGPRTITATDPRLAALFVDESQLVGMAGPKGELIGWLSAQDSPHCVVISVMGMGGLGKTTLARKVYESPELSNTQFNCRAWITVSQSMDIRALLRDMIKQIVSPLPEKWEEIKDEAQLVQTVRSHLQDKRYVIVFDDLWYVIHWNTILSALPLITPGSRIMVTTRKEEVAHTCCKQNHGYVYRLNPLSREQSWDLFCKKVFTEPPHSCPAHLKDLSEQILKKCGGLPLAVVTIGGLLASKPNKTRQEWQKLHDYLGVEMGTNPSLDGMKPILDLSYQDLSAHLKSCFLYLSIFPEDHTIHRSRLVFHWVAQGFVEHIPGVEPEEIAKGYFNDLVYRSMVQPWELMWDGAVKSCRVHDIVRELIISKSREEMNLRVVDQNDTIEDCRHLSILRNYNAELVGTRSNKFRSVTLFNEADPMPFVSIPFKTMKLLKVLDLPGCRYLPYGILDSIGELVHLKFLNLRGLSSVTKLTKSFGKLRNLETLDLRGTSVNQGENAIFQLQQLRQLLFTYAFRSGRGLRLSSQSTSLNSGRILNMKSTLKTLSRVSASGCSKRDIKELGELVKLRKLAVMDVSEVDHGMELCGVLEKLSRGLRSLTVWMDYGCLGFGFMDSMMSSPPLQLVTLNLGAPIVQVLPRWISSLHNLSKLTIQKCGLGDESFKVLGALPCLVDLRIYFYSNIYYSMSPWDICFGDHGFQTLKSLTLRIRTNGVNKHVIKFGEGAMPSLEQLRLVELRLVDYTESNFPQEGIFQYFTCLKHVFLHNYGISGISPGLIRAVEEHPNHPKLTMCPWHSTTYYRKELYYR